MRVVAWHVWSAWPGASVLIVDPAWHARLGHAIAGGDLAAGSGAWAVTPGPAYLFALGELAGWGDALGQAAVQLVFGVASVAAIIATGTALGGAGAGAAAGWLAALCGPLVFQDLAALSVSPAVLGLAVAAGSAVSGRRPLAGGLALGLAAWIRPNLLLLGPVAAVAAALPIADGSRRSGSRGVFFALGLALALAPALVRNRVVGGEWVLLSANGGYNLALSQEPGLRQNLVSAVDAPTNLDAILAEMRAEPEKVLRHAPGVAEADQWWRGVAMDRIRQDVPGFLLRTAGRAWLVAGALDTQDHRAWHAHRRDRLGWLPDPALVVPGLAVVGLISLPRRKALAAGALLAAGVASLALFVVSERYRLPLLGVVLPVAGVGVTAVARRPWWLAAVGAVAIVASVDPFKERLVLPWGVAGATSSLEAEGVRRESAELAASAGALAEAGRMEDAIALYRRAVELVPERFELSQNLAALLLSRGDASGAVALAEDLKRRFPTDGRRALLACSVALQARDSGALSACERARMIAPGSAAAWWQAGMARWSVGDTRAAEEAVVRALRLDPSLPGGMEALRALRSGGAGEGAGAGAGTGAGR